MTKLASPPVRLKFTLADGVTPNAGGKLYTYAAGTAFVTPLAVYQDQAGASAHPNPLTIPASGEVEIFLTPGRTYDFRETLPDGVTIVKNSLNISASAGEADAVNFPDSLAPAYLKTVSDVLNAGEVDVLRAIPKEQWAAIHASTSTYDATTDLNDLLADMAVRGGQLILPHGRLRVNSGLLLDYTGAASDDENRIITIRGQGAKSSEIYGPATSGDVFKVIGAWPYATPVTLEGFRISGSGGTSKALNVVKAAHLKLRDVIVRGAQYGLYLEDCLSVNTEGVQSIFNTFGGRLFRNTLTYPNLINFRGGSVGGNATAGLKIEGGVCANLSGVGFEGNGSGLATASASGYGLWLENAGNEGRAAGSIRGCYFENNNGLADVLLTQSSMDVAVEISGNTFNRISSTTYTTNNIRLETTGTGFIRADIRANGFLRAGTYVADAARKTILATGVANSVFVDLGPNSYTDTVDAPSMAQSGRLADFDCHPQAWIRATGAGVVQSSRQVNSLVRNGVGDYTITFSHGLPATKCYHVQLPSTVNLNWDLFSEGADNFRFTVKNNAGAATDPTYLMVTVFG